MRGATLVDIIKLSLMPFIGLLTIARSSIALLRDELPIAMSLAASYPAWLTGAINANAPIARVLIPTICVFRDLDKNREFIFVNLSVLFVALIIKYGNALLTMGKISKAITDVYLRHRGLI